MRVALVADVHGNLPALEAVLEHARGLGTEATWNLGDFLGYGPFPEEVVQRFRRDRVPSILGNYDLKVLAFPKKKKVWRRKKAPKKYLAFGWAYERLSSGSRRYLAGLPTELRLAVGPLRVLLTHGSPAGVDDPLSSDTPKRRFRQLAEIAQADVVACGHTHRQFERRVDGVWFVNPGSVGRPEGGDPRACYAILDFDGEQLEVRQQRVDYDVDRAVRAIREAGLPGEFADMLQQGRNLMEIESQDNNPAYAAEAIVPSQHAAILQGVDRLRQRCHDEVEHTGQVTTLALELFDELAELHGLGEEERFWLQCGGLLHDIGWLYGQQGHHKSSLELILEAPELALDERHRTIVGSIARYHRRALPKAKHEHFAALSEEDQHKVSALAGILRVADGLDRTHTARVRGVACHVEEETVVLTCQVDGPADAELWAADKKKDLFEQVFRRELVLDVAGTAT